LTITGKKFHQWGIRALDVLGVLFVVASIFSVFYYWDPTRTFIKRWQEPDPYIFEAIDPTLFAYDPVTSLSVHGDDDIHRVRHQLISIVWGEEGIPFHRMPNKTRLSIQSDPGITAGCHDVEIPHTRRRLHCEVHGYAHWSNLAGVDDLTVSIDNEYTSSIGYFRPQDPNGVLVLYQHGYAGTYHDQHRIIERLISDGYTVAALNHVSYGDNRCPDGRPEYCYVGWGTFQVPLPMRLHFTPPVVAINYALSQGHVRGIAMIGLSAGAWVTAVTAAVDTRVDISFPIAGVMPKPLVRGNEWPKAERYEPLINAASFPDLYVLASDSPKRRQTQIFNQYDRCCYSGLRPLLFADSLKTFIGHLTGGVFNVVIDESHPRHKISRRALAVIADELRLLSEDPKN